MLDKIPPELLEIIVCKIVNTVDLKNLCEVSKYLCRFATPYLYRSITLNNREGSLKDLHQRLDRLPFGKLEKYTRDLSFKAPFRRVLRKRCPHHYVAFRQLRRELAHNGDDGMQDAAAGIGSSESSSMEGEDSYDMSLGLQTALSCLTENNLRSFRWDLGTCIPEDVLSPAGQLANHQKHIETLSLITDGGCNAESIDILDLTPFSRVQSFTWRGINRGDHFQSLREFIRANSNGIQTLFLDLVVWMKAQKIWFDHQRATLGGLPHRPDNFFARKVLGIQPEEERILFPALKSLLLSAVSFRWAESEMIHAFNICNLSTLRLWNCPSCLVLLNEVVDTAQIISLKKFELLIDLTRLDSRMGLEEAQKDMVAKFLCAFRGLEDLSLMLTQPLSWRAIVKGILNHISTLKRLVIHERGIDYDSDLPQDGHIPWSDQGILFGDLRLSYIGTSSSSSLLGSELRELSPKPRCRILHIRASGIDQLESDVSHDSVIEDDSDIDSNMDVSPQGPALPDSLLPAPGRIRQLANRSHLDGLIADFLKLAQWAFGPDGLPDLEVLALGDFSNEGRWVKYNMLLCRDQNVLAQTGYSFRTLHDRDLYYWDLVQDNMDMLAACPADSLMWWRDMY